MILLTADSSKDFMAKLLVSDAFDPFCMQEATVMTSVSYNINGRIHRDFYPEEERERLSDEFIPWSEIRPKVFELIKGKNAPVSFKFTLSLKTDSMHALMQKEIPDGYSSALKALVINIRFENGSIVIMTGTSYDSFIMDRTEEKVWDSAFMRYLSAKEIAFTLND